MDKPDIVILSHQRSGTHFLQESLASHPNISPRGEFVMRYRRLRDDGVTPEIMAATESLSHIVRNKQGYVNVGIVMYSQIDLFERLCGPLLENKIVHLLRDPKNVARSVLRLKQGHVVDGANFRAHYRIGETPPPPSPIDEKHICEVEKKILGLQYRYTRLLQECSCCMTISYEDLTGDVQVNVIKEEVARRLLSFLSLDYCVLKNGLIKTSNV